MNKTDKLEAGLNVPFEVWWKGQIARDFVQSALTELEKISGPKLIAGEGGFAAEATAISAARRSLDSALSVLDNAERMASCVSVAAPPSFEEAQIQKLYEDPHPGYDCGGLCAIHKFASPVAATVDAETLVDEVQHCMDQVVEAAVEWHQSEQQEWIEASEKLGAAIDSLLELRSAPAATPTSKQT